ncbi:MAG: RNA polymerase Rpb4 family protein [Candidatus Bathyarchaeia archaeon]
MPRKILKVQPITIPEAKMILESLGEESLDQLQRRALDYATKMSYLDHESARKLLEELKAEGTLSEEEAVQIVNVMPKSVEELRIFLSGGRKIIETSKLEKILSILDKYRKE